VNLKTIRGDGVIDWRHGEQRTSPMLGLDLDDPVHDRDESDQRGLAPANSLK